MLCSEKGLGLGDPSVACLSQIQLHGHLHVITSSSSAKAGAEHRDAAGTPTRLVGH